VSLPPVVEREPCTCHDCVVAGVSALPQRLDPRTREWLHGRDLAKWYAAKRAYEEQIAKVFKTMKGMR
jgi:hypothetical protein